MARTMVEIPFAGDQAERWKRRCAAFWRRISIRRSTTTGKRCGRWAPALRRRCTFIKTEYAGQTLRLYGWVQIGVGSAGGKERDLTGVVGAIPKKSVKKTMEKIRAVIA